MKNLSMYMKIFLLAAAILLFYKLMFDSQSITGTFGSIFGIIKPFVWGFVIAYCINIPCEWLEEKMNRAKFKWVGKISRPFSLVAGLLVTAALLFFGIRGFIPMIYENAKQLFEQIPDYIENALITVNNLPFALELGLDERINAILKEQPWMDLIPSAQDTMSMAGSFLSGFFNGILTFVSTIYFMVEYKKIKEFFKRAIRTIFVKSEKYIIRYIRLVNSSFRKFISCQALDSLILASITMIEFSILGSPYAITMGLMLGVLNIIPYFGSIFGSMIAVFLIWSTNGLQTALIAAVVLLVTQQFDGNFINPRIMGTSFSVSPVLVIIGITVGGALGGVAGMILAVPVVNVLKTLLEEYLQNKQKKNEKKSIKATVSPKEQ